MSRTIRTAAWTTLAFAAFLALMHWATPTCPAGQQLDYNGFCTVVVTP